MQVLCANCHRKKTNRDIGGTARTKLLKSLGYDKFGNIVEEERK